MLNLAFLKGRAARAYKQDIWFAVFDLTKDDNHLAMALGGIKRMKAFSPHRNHVREWPFFPISSLITLFYSVFQ